jgi:hypothetical protein
MDSFFVLSKPSSILWGLENGCNFWNCGLLIHQVTQYPITMTSKSLSKNHFSAKRLSFLRNTIYHSGIFYLHISQQLCEQIWCLRLHLETLIRLVLCWRTSPFHLQACKWILNSKLRGFCQKEVVHSNYLIFMFQRKLEFWSKVWF